MATDVERLRRKLGDTGTPAAFTDAELTALLAEEGTFAGALRAGLWELLAPGAKLHNYQLASGAESKGEVFDHLLELYRLAGGEAVGPGGVEDTSRAVQTGALTYATFPAGDEYGG